MYDCGAVEGLITLPGTCLSPILTNTGSLAIGVDNGCVLCLLLKYNSCFALNSLCALRKSFR